MAKRECEIVLLVKHTAQQRLTDRGELTVFLVDCSVLAKSQNVGRRPTAHVLKAQRVRVLGVLTFQTHNVAFDSFDSTNLVKKQKSISCCQNR